MLSKVFSRTKSMNKSLLYANSKIISTFSLKKKQPSKPVVETQEELVKFVFDENTKALIFTHTNGEVLSLFQMDKSKW